MLCDTVSIEILCDIDTLLVAKHRMIQVGMLFIHAHLDHVMFGDE